MRYCCQILQLTNPRCLVTHLRIAIEVVKEAARALEDVPSLIFFPFIPFCAGVLFFFYWIVITLYLFSVQIPVTKEMPANLRDKLGTTYTDYKWNQDYKGWWLWDDCRIALSFCTGLFGLNLFVLLWVSAFLIYFTYMVTAGTLANWYFTPRQNGRTGPKIRGDGEGVCIIDPSMQCSSLHDSNCRRKLCSRLSNEPPVSIWERSRSPLS